MPDWHDWLPAVQFWQLEVLLAAVVVLSLLELPALARAVDASGRTWAGAAAAGATALALTIGLAPRTNRILYDELIYQHVGQNLADRGRAETCNDGTVADGRLQCRLTEYSKHPYGYPHLLSVVYRAAGVDERHAWTVNNITAGLLPVVVCAVTVLLFADRRAGMLAATAAALVPQQWIWSNTAAVEPTAALAASLAVLAAAWFARSGRTRALVWTVVAAAWACQFRIESVLVVPVAIAIALIGRQAWRDVRIWCAGAAGALLLAPLLLHVIAVSGQSWGAPTERLSLAFVRDNLSVNGPFYLTNLRFPVVVTVLAAAGVIARRRQAVAWAVVAYFVLFWSIYLSFYAGSYDHGADVRFSLLTHPPLAILAGLGASAVAGRIRWPAARAAVPLGLAASCVSFVPLVARVGEDGWQARADVAAAREFAALVPPGGVVLTHNPSMFLLFGVGAAQMSLAAVDPAYVSDRLGPRAPGGVYYHHNFWCAVSDPVQTRFCTEVRARFALDLVAERHVRDVRYALYRLRVPGRELASASSFLVPDVPVVPVHSCALTLFGFPGR